MQAMISHDGDVNMSDTTPFVPPQNTMFRKIHSSLKEQGVSSVTHSFHSGTATER